MTSMAGARFGPYLIQTSLGRGGMGEVHRAVDTRLDRTVAIKILPRELASNPLRQQRFEREARALSALNHPHICALYDLGEQEGVPFLVMEYVEGETLRDRLLNGPMAVDRLLQCAKEIAAALDHAHHHGVVHRDLKPANIMLTKSGVKVVDFGVARLLAGEAVAAGSWHAETLSEPGSLVGTPQYMAPEQLQGREADARSDIFAFGAVIYEMGTGRPVFAGQSAVNVISSILTSEPPPMSVVRLEQRAGQPDTALPIMALLDQIIGRCLAKDPDDRWQTARDLRQMIEWVADRAHADAGSIVIRDRNQASQRKNLKAALIVSAVLAATVGTFVLDSVSQSSNAFDQYRYTPLATDSGFQGSPAWSPDGKTLAYVAEVDGVLQVFTKQIGSPMRAQVTHTHFDCRVPFWSPDGTRVYYISQARDREGLWSISAAGGAPEIVMENAIDAALSPDGKRLAFLRAEDRNGVGGVTLWFSSPPGARPSQYVRWALGSRDFSEGVLHFSPDGSELGVWLESIPDKQRQRGDLWVIPTNGNPRVALSLPPQLYIGRFSWMPDSRYLVTALKAFQTSSEHLWLVDTRRGSLTPLTVTSSNETEPAVTPDGSRIAMTVREANYDIFEIASDRPTLVPILATSQNELDPAWSARGAQMAFVTERSGQQELWLRSDHGEWERPLVTADTFTSPTVFMGSPAFSPDGERLAFFRRGDVKRIWTIPVAGGTPVQIAPSGYEQSAATWSADGDWIAYTQLREGTYFLEKIRIGGKAEPEVLARDILPQSKVDWSPDGSWIAYSGQDGLAIVSADGKTNRAVLDQMMFGFAWSEDSRRLFGLRASDDSRYLTFTSVDIASSKETVIKAQLIPLPIAREPVSGFTRLSSTRFATAIVQVKSDVWVLDGFQRPITLWDRLSPAFIRRSMSSLRP